MKPRHLVLIVAIGTGLIAFAPTAEQAGRPEATKTAAEPAQEVKATPDESHAKIEPASFTGDAEHLKTR